MNNSLGELQFKDYCQECSRQSCEVDTVLNMHAYTLLNASPSLVHLMSIQPVDPGLPSCTHYYIPLLLPHAVLIPLIHFPNIVLFFFLYKVYNVKANFPNPSI